MASSGASSGKITLRAENNDGSESDISEADLYRYIRYRWIYNEQTELSKRYLKFDLGNLAKAAIQATGSKSAYCQKVLKCKEGLHNKALLLTMNDGTEVFAKLPNPNSGPVHLTVASEVATRQFLRDVLSIPTPMILGWSSDPNNPVGAEYILEEKSPGLSLGSLWHQMPRKSKLDIISQVVELEERLASLTFQGHGSIYFRDSLQHEPVEYWPLATTPPASSDINDRFVLGPVTTAELWERNETDLNIERGPWHNLLEYIQAMGKNEIERVQTFAKPRQAPYLATEIPEAPETFISHAEQYLQLAPHLVPPATTMDILSPTLWHPDLHRDNVFIDPDTNKITGILDWQSAVVAPLFLQSGVPRMFRHYKQVDNDWAVPEPPSNFDSLSVGEQASVKAELESLTYHKYYKYQSLKKNPRHWACLEQQERLELRTTPIKLVTNCWRNKDVFYFRESLMALAKRWDELEGSDSPCPVSFSEAVYQIHAQEEANIETMGEILRIFRDEDILPVDGIVEPIDYERAQKSNRKFKGIFIGLAATPEAKKLHERLWPYQDSGKE